MDTYFPTGIIFALIGGALSAGFVSYKNKTPLILSIFAIFIGAGSSAALIEYLKIVEFYWQCFILGLPVGVLAPQTLVMIEVFSPTLIPRILKKYTGIDIEEEVKQHKESIK